MTVTLLSPRKGRQVRAASTKGLAGEVWPKDSPISDLEVQIANATLADCPSGQAGDAVCYAVNSTVSFIFDEGDFDMEDGSPVQAFANNLSSAVEDGSLADAVEEVVPTLALAVLPASASSPFPSVKM